MQRARLLFQPETYCPSMSGIRGGRETATYLRYCPPQRDSRADVLSISPLSKVFLTK